MLKIGRLPAALFFAANFFALAAGANQQNAHSPTAPFVDSAQILKAGSKVREESARDALSSGLPALAQLIIEDGEKDGGGQIGTDEILVYVDSLIAQGKFEKALRRILPIVESAPTPENKIREALAYIGLGEVGKVKILGTHGTHRLIDCLLIRSGLDSFNLFWFFFFVPFAILTITRFYGVTGVLTYLIGIWLLMLLNNYWFLLCRMLMGEHFCWFLLPVLVYGALGAAFFIPDESPLFDFCINVGEGFILGNWLTFAVTLAIIALFYLLDRYVIGKMIYGEINKVEDTTVQVKHVSEYRFLERYGQVGEYMKLELKMLLRNKICKRGLYSAGGVVLVFSALIAFTDAYQGGMKDFLVMYNFALFGILFLSTIMGYEGNYIDGLMSRKESIYSLLQAKYAIYSIGQVIPLVMIIPAIIMGKVTLLTAISWFFFIPGFVYFGMFQMAVYNNRTVDMNNKMTQRNVGTGMQNLISSAVFIVPLLLYFLLHFLTGETTTAWIFIAIGLAFILTSRYWLRNVYNRFMKRRYKNMEGFRDSRQK